MLSKARQIAAAVLPGILKPLRVLWNEVIGFMFVVLAVVFGFSTWRKRDQFPDDLQGFLLIGASALFVLMLAAFGISSFWRARKINKT
jgi:hypothetical protein